MSDSVFTVGRASIVWRSIKQSCITDFTMEAENIAACEAGKNQFGLKKFYTYLKYVPNVDKSQMLYCDNIGAMTNSKEPISHTRGKHTERKDRAQKRCQCSQYCFGRQFDGLVHQYTCQKGFLTNTYQDQDLET